MNSFRNIKGQKILYIATKNSDYLRLTQEIRLLREQGNEVTEISSPAKSYFKRLLYVYRKLLFTDISAFDMVFAGFSPQLIVPLFRRKLKKKPLAIDFFISLYDTLCFDRKKFRPKSIPGRLLKRLDRKTLAAADMTVCDTKAHGRYFCGEFGYPPEKMNVLYLEADTSIYYPRETPPNKDFTVLYFGSVLPLQGVDVILKAIDILRDETGLRFIFVGPLGKNNVRTGENITEYISWLSQDELAEKIASADLCLAGHFNGSIMKAKRTIPGKAYIYHAMGKPMILGEGPANHELFKDDGKSVYFCNMSDPQALAELILKIKEQENS